MAQVLSDALRIEFGYNYTPLSPLGTISWTDVTSSVMLSEGVTLNRGRFGSDLTARPGSLSFTLDNSKQGGTEGRFTVGGTNQVAGLALRIPVRVRAKFPLGGSAYVPLWLGYVESFETQWDNGFRPVVRVSASDRLARLEKRKLPSLIRGAQLRSYTPAALWPLTEGDGAATFGDTSGSNASALTLTTIGSGTPTILLGTANTGPGPDGLSAPVITPSGSAPFTNGYSFSLNSELSSSYRTIAGSTLECYFYVAAAGTRSGLMSFTGRGDDIGIRISAGNKLEAAGDLSTMTGTTTITSGVWHHMALTRLASTGAANLYLDGVLEGTSTSFSHDAGFGTIFSAGYDAVSGQCLSGRISHVALYTSKLSSSDIADRVAVRDTLSSYTVETPDTKFARIAKIAGLTTSEYGFNYGSSGAMSSTMTPFPVGDRPLLEALNECAIAEASTVYLDASGVLTLSSRDDRYNVSSSFSLPATAIDKNTSFTNDMTFVVNDVTVQRPAGATARTVNAASVAAYDTHDQSITAYVGTDQQAIDMASYLANINSQPYPRVSNIGVDMVSAAAVVDEAAILAAEVGTRFTVTGLPSASTPVTTLSWFVEGVTDTVSATSWKRTFVGTQVNSANTAWILDTSVLDTSTILGF
jgi:hypothetical protein